MHGINGFNFKIIFFYIIRNFQGLSILCTGRYGVPVYPEMVPVWYWKEKVGNPVEVMIISMEPDPLNSTKNKFPLQDEH